MTAKFMFCLRSVLFFSLIGASLASFPQARAQETSPVPSAVGRIEGVLFEKGTKTPLPNVNVFVLPAKLKATTDAFGRFVIERVPADSIRIVVNSSGYQRLDRGEEIAPGQTRSLRLYLERETYQGLKETVVDRAKKRDDTTRTLKTEQFLSMPGSNGDPVKAVQNLPGVARVGGVSSQVIIQGSAPQDTGYLLDEHDVPLVFHFGGLTSVITPEAIDQVDYLSAGYGPEYGRAMGGLVGLRTRSPATDRRKGFLFADITKAGFLIEGPIDEKSAYLITGRYSYLGFVLQQALKDNPRFDLTVAPSFGDLSLIYTNKLTPKDDLKVLAIVSHDELKFVLKEPLREEPSLRGNFSNETTFYRFVPQWTHRYENGATGRYSIGVGQDLVKVDAGDLFFNLESSSLTQRAELEKKLSPSWTSYLGMDNQLSYYTVKLALPTTNSGGGIQSPISSGERITLDVSDTSLNLAPYWRNTIKAEDSPWTLMPSVRVDYFDITNEVKPAPRLAGRYDQDDSLFYRAAAGLYYQAPQPQETAPDYGNPTLRSPHAWHFTAGAEKDFRQGSTDGFVVQSTLFYKLFEDLVLSSSARRSDGTFERFNNEGTGRAHGLEMLIKYDQKPWSAWLAYTFSQSYRTEPGQGEHPFQYDQTHNINLVGSYEFSDNWKLSSRVRYVTGNPYTPVVGGTFDADNDVYVPQRGPFYSERNDGFFQVDLRADKKWVYDEWILWGYLDVQNVTNHENSEGIRYSYDYSQKRTVTGLPVLPIIGVRGEF